MKPFREGNANSNGRSASICYYHSNCEHVHEIGMLVLICDKRTCIYLRYVELPTGIARTVILWQLELHLISYFVGISVEHVNFLSRTGILQN